METIEKHPLVIGESKTNSGYTVFKNTDEELVKKIKALNVPSDTWIENGFMTGAKGKCRVDKKLSDTQFLCVDEHGHYFVKDADSFEDTNREELLNKINTEFNVADYLNKNLNLYSHSGHEKISFEHYKEYFKRFPDYEENIERVDFMMSGYDSHGRINSKFSGVALYTFESIVLVEGDNLSSSSMFCYFNEDGNIENRDYNFDIKKFLNNKPKTKEDLIQEIIDEIPDVEYKFYGNKWYANNFAFVLDEEAKGQEFDEHRYEGNIVFKITKLHHKSGDNYASRYSGVKARIPKQFEVVGREHILNKILPLVNEMKYGSY